jgi:hypothetical protein
VSLACADPRAAVAAAGRLGYALAHLVSAAFAGENQALAFKFGARMSVMAVFAWLVAATPETARRRALAAFVASGALVACLAIAEGSGVRVLDGFLGPVS